jgi:hypothetical protein
VVTWAEFEAAAPDMAADARILLRRDGIDQAMLATVRGDELPRINPIYVGIVDGRLYAFLLGSTKLNALEQDGRFALHSHQDSKTLSEFLARGRAGPVDDDDVRAAVAATWTFEVDETYRLFDFSIEAATIGRRDGPDEWPPRYQSWRAGSGAG